MDYPLNRFGSLAILTFLILGVTYISLSSTNFSKSFLSFKKNYQCSSNSSPNNQLMVQQDELERALDGASMANKTLVIAILNKAYVEGERSMLDLFLQSFWVGNGTQELINHLLLVAMDETAFRRCEFLRLHCYRLKTDGVDFGGEKLYMSRDFINMMWRRTSFLAEVLKRGYSFIFTDTDIMWLGNPFTKLSKDEGDDIQISVDKFNGNPWSASNPINTGFYFIRSNNKTTTLFKTWYAMRNDSNYKGMKEQDVLEKMVQKGVFLQLGLKVRFLDTVFFSGFCENSRDFKVVATVHANCCRSIQAKVNDLVVVLRDWGKYRNLIDDESKRNVSMSAVNGTRIGWSRHVACVRSWRNFNESLAGK